MKIYIWSTDFPTYSIRIWMMSQCIDKAYSNADKLELVPLEKKRNHL